MRLTRERLLLLALLAATITVWVLAIGAATASLTITVFDVGQGDSMLIQAPGGRTVLIDGGGVEGEETRGYEIGKDVVVPALLARGVRKLDLLVITHQHEDHTGGLRAVVDQVPVGMVLDPELPPTNDTYRELLDAIRKHNIPLRRATEGQQINLEDGVTLEVLSPPTPRLEAASPENENAIVMRLTDGGFSMVFAGDIEMAGAQHVACLGPSVRSIVLKVPHHGSADIVGTGLVQAVHPELAVISVGAHNTFGHPARETLDELQAVGAKVMRTDRDGAITIRVRPPQWWARGYVRGAKELSGTVKEAE